VSVGLPARTLAPEAGARARRWRRWVRRAAGVALLAVALGYLARVVEPGEVRSALAAVARRPGALLGALLLYGLAFGLRAWAWCRVLPGLGLGQSWAALHVSLLGNHVLPFRLGEALRVTSVLRRTDLPAAPVTASALVLRTADLLAVLALAALAAPALAMLGTDGRGGPAGDGSAAARPARDGLAGADSAGDGSVADGLLGSVGGGWLWALAAVLVLLGAAGVGWSAALRRRGHDLRLPGAGVAAAATIAWLLESAMMWAAAGAAGIDLSFPAAVAVTAVTIAAQAVAVTPGGIGSYEAAATAALVGLGAGPGPALAAAIVAHAAKTGYAVAVGGVALAAPAPGYLGRFRLPRRLPPRPARAPVPDTAPIVAMIPAYQEEATVGAVVGRLPAVACGRPVVSLVVDDGSTDATAARAAAAGATVISQPANLGLGATVRRGLAEAVRRRPACVVYLDADGEYRPEELDRLAAPVLAGAADYVVGSRCRGGPRRMRRHRMVGNRVLTAWVRWMTRRPDLTDGQSGYRAFSPEAAAAAEVVHDYNYAQVLTLDLLAKGYAYAEVPIGYAFRTSGTSFVRLGRYLRRVVPAVHRELNAA
jgi:uncharacterized membrane protein YbhN (UPF0104 family)